MTTSLAIWRPIVNNNSNKINLLFDISQELKYVYMYHLEKMYEFKIEI